MSSSSLDQRRAFEFAGEGGIVLRIRLNNAGSHSRDIKDLSAYESEDEILLLPNFKCVVVDTVKHINGIPTICLLEQKEVASHIF